MKTILKSIIVAATLCVCSMSPTVSIAQPDQAVTLQTFYDELSPYGQWINYPGYGNVFIPSAGPGFTPYSTAGHWVYTDQYGWTWASDYPWGWACFHYGRWNYDPSYGWFWVPDTQWGPAWVCWRNSDQYYGWAPLPSGVDINAGLSSGYGIPADQWCFVPCQYMGDPFINRYYMPRMNNDIFIAHSAFIVRMNYDGIHHFNFFLGPDRVEVERYRHAPVDRVVLNFNADPHHVYGPHEVGIYHPAPSVIVRHDEVRHDEDRHDQVRHDEVRHDAPAPARVVRVQDVPQRDANHQHATVIVPNNRGGAQRGNDRNGRH